MATNALSEGCWPLVIQLFFPCRKRGAEGWRREKLKLQAGRFLAGFFGSCRFRPTEATDMCMCGIS